MIKKLSLYLAVFLTVLFVLFLVLYKADNNSKLITNFKNLFPISLKGKIKSFVFAIPELKKENEKQYYALRKANREIAILQDKINSLLINDIKENNDYYVYPTISSISKTEKIFHYNLPLSNYYLTKKPGFYFDKYKDTFVIITGIGETFLINENFHDNKSLNLKYLKNNIKNIVVDQNFFDKNQSNRHSYSISVKDLTVIKDQVFVSYTKKFDDNCYNTSIIKSDIALELKFEEFFSYDDCVKVKNEFAGVQSGGRIEFNKKNNSVYFSIGDYRNRPLAQDRKSIFGKIIEINLDTKDYKIVSIGHRNPQGLYYSEKYDYLISTEHGPYGGDEINLILEGENYGWPISSYGNHYDEKSRPEAPLHKSHLKYGFKEPIFNWGPVSSIGVSEIESIDEKNNIFFVASLRAKKGFLFDFDEKFEKYKIIKEYAVGERIRDVYYDKETNLLIISIENSPALAVIDANEYKNVFPHKNKLWKWQWSAF